jgi:hypothetical protein
MLVSLGLTEEPVVSMLAKLVARLERQPGYASGIDSTETSPRTTDEMVSWVAGEARARA